PAERRMAGACQPNPHDVRPPRDSKPDQAKRDRVADLSDNGVRTSALPAAAGGGCRRQPREPELPPPLEFKDVGASPRQFLQISQGSANRVAAAAMDFCKAWRAGRIDRLDRQIPARL